MAETARGDASQHVNGEQFAERERERDGRDEANGRFMAPLLIMVDAPLMPDTFLQQRNNVKLENRNNSAGRSLADPGIVMEKLRIFGLRNVK